MLNFIHDVWLNEVSSVFPMLKLSQNFAKNLLEYFTSTALQKPPNYTVFFEIFTVPTWFRPDNYLTTTSSCYILDFIIDGIQTLVLNLPPLSKGDW